MNLHVALPAHFTVVDLHRVFVAPQWKIKLYLGARLMQWDPAANAIDRRESGNVFGFR